MPTMIALDKIVVEKIVYPRHTYGENSTPWWGITQLYARDMRAGAHFPPITLCKLNGKIILVDGLHTLLARKSLKFKDIEAEFIVCKNYDEIYIAAIRRNRKHKQGLTEMEIATVIATLRQKKYNYKNIAEIVSLPLADVKKIELTKIIWTNNDFTYVKPIVSTTATRGITAEQQALYLDSNQVQLLKQVIALIKDKLMDYDNKEVRSCIVELADLLSGVVVNPP